MILQTTDIERTVLSSLLWCDLSPDKRLESFKLDASYFTHPLHKSVAKAIRKLQEKQYPPHDAYVQEMLHISKQDTQTQNAYIEILAATPIADYENLSRYYNILKRRQAQRLLKVLK